MCDGKVVTIEGKQYRLVAVEPPAPPEPEREPFCYIVGWRLAHDCAGDFVFDHEASGMRCYVSFFNRKVSLSVGLPNGSAIQGTRSTATVKYPEAMLNAHKS